MEIEMFFAKYDTDGDGILGWEEGTQIVKDLESDNIDEGARPSSGLRPGTGGFRPSTATQRINHEEFGMLAKRVDRMEGVIGSIVSKIDMVLIKLESMEKSKNKKRANLDKVFDVFGGEADPGSDVKKTD